MKSTARGSLVGLLVLLAVLSIGRSQSTDHVTAFVGATVISMESEGAIPDQTVIVRGDRITEISPVRNTRVPEGVTSIDSKGKFLMPGLAEMHGHNPPLGSSEEFTETVYFLFVANGVTTVRGMLGWPGQLELREKVARDELLGPTLYLAGPSFSGTSIQSALQAEKRVREQKAESWDLLKVHPGVKRDHYDAMARTAKEVGIRFGGHIPADVGLAHAIAMGHETVDHLDGYIEYLDALNAPLDVRKVAAAVKLTRDTGTWVVPTMCLWETILGSANLETMSNYPELKYMPPEQVAQWKDAYKRLIENTSFNRNRAQQIAANRKVLLKELSEGGVKILFGTDSPQQFSVPGFSIHREIKAMIETGMKPAQILRSATKNPGDYFKDKDKFGTISVGSRADLLLLEANPLENTANVARRAGVMVRGKWISEGEIQQRLDKIANAWTRRTK